MTISTVISYCSNDKDFINACISHAKPFSKQISVCACTNFFDGQKEDSENLMKVVEANQPLLFTIFPFYQRFQGDRENYGQWHNRMRAHGWQSLTEPTDWVLFLDADEIVDTDKFIHWLANFNVNASSAYRFLGYWYFRDTCWQANQTEEVSVMTRWNKCNWNYLDCCPGERFGLLDAQSQRNVADILNQPMFHHYSWARTKEGMLRKVKSWGHSGNKPWNELIEKEFKREFNETCKDFVHNYTFKKVGPFINARIT